jgi:hypothetical protein
MLDGLRVMNQEVLSSVNITALLRRGLLVRGFLAGDG